MGQHMSMTYHVTAVCAACNYHLYILSSILNYLITEARTNAVNALVTFRLDYSNSLLHNIPLSQTTWLQRAQNNVAWLIICTSKHDHITPMLDELHWLPEILINSNCCEMTDTALEFLYSAMHVLISVYVLD